MVDEEWRSSAGLSLALPTLLLLESMLPLESVHAAAEIDGERLGVIHVEGDDPLWAVLIRVDEFEPPSWTPLSRHESWSEEHDTSSEALGIYIDLHAGSVPVSSPNRPIVVVNIPCRNGLDCLYLTDTGVALTTQLFAAPEKLDHGLHDWSTFAEAMRDVTTQWGPDL